MLEELGEGGDVAGAQEGECAVLYLCGPVGSLGVKGVEEVFLDSAAVDNEKVSIRFPIAVVFDFGRKRRELSIGVWGRVLEQSNEREGGKGANKKGSLLLVMPFGDQGDVKLRSQVHIHGGRCVTCCSPGDLDFVWFWL